MREEEVLIEKKIGREKCTNFNRRAKVRKHTEDMWPGVAEHKAENIKGMFGRPKIPESMGG